MFRTSGPALGPLPACLAGVILLLALPEAASAHHVLEITGLPPTPLNGLLSGLAHPVLGPDHLLFLLALSLVGLRRRGAWMLGLLAVGLLGNGLGLVLPGLPGSEALVALSLVLLALVLQDRLPNLLLLPAFALHGYVLSSSVLGWNAVPLTTYLVGLLLSQGLLLALALSVLRRFADALQQPWRRAAAFLLIGFGSLTAASLLLA